MLKSNSSTAQDLPVQTTKPLKLVSPNSAEETGENEKNKEIMWVQIE